MPCAKVYGPQSHPPLILVYWDDPEFVQFFLPMRIKALLLRPHSGLVYFVARALGHVALQRQEPVSSHPCKHDSLVQMTGL